MVVVTVGGAVGMHGGDGDMGSRTTGSSHSLGAWLL